MLKKALADKDVELTALREQLDAKEDGMNRLEAEVLHPVHARSASNTSAGRRAARVARARAEYSV